MRRFKSALTAGAAAALLIGAAGCQASGSPDPETKGASSPTTVRVMLWGNDQDISTIKDAAAGYISSHADVNIKWETGDCAVDYAACKTLVAGRNMPDVVVTGSWNYYQMAKDGVIADLTPFIKDTGLELSDFTPSVIGALTKKDTGAVYALPMGYNVQSLYYNADMFKAAGLAAPPADGSYTYDDLRNWARALTLDVNGNTADSPSFDPKSIQQYGYFNFAAGMIEPGYAPVLSAFGGGVLGGDARNECTLEKPGTIEGFQYLQDLMWKDHSAITPQLQQEEPGYQRFVRGQVAMQQGSHEQVLTIRAQNPDLKYGMAALPEGPAGNATLMQIHTWAMFDGSEVKDAAFDFIKYMATKGSGKQMGLIPAYKDVALGDAFATAKGEPANLEAAQIVPASWPASMTNVDPSGLWAAVSSQDGFGQALEDIVMNRAPASQALAGICKGRINPLIGQQN